MAPTYLMPTILPSLKTLQTDFVKAVTRVALQDARSGFTGTVARNGCASIVFIDQRMPPESAHLRPAAK
jgi:hypothetical protein